MTHRERAEARLERRRQWAASRQTQANALFARGDKYRGDVAFDTQPGHIPERARVLAAHDKACESLQMVAHHESKAAGIEKQLANTIYSDDADAVDAIRAKVTAGRAELATWKAANKAWRKEGMTGLVKIGWTVAEAEACAKRIETAYSWEKQPYVKWQISNHGANMRRLEGRIVEIERRQKRTEEAEAAGGVVVTGDDWVFVTFAEKPDYSVITALKAAGFRWGGGTWHGERAKLPVGILPEPKTEAKPEPKTEPKTEPKAFSDIENAARFDRIEEDDPDRKAKLEAQWNKAETAATSGQVICLSDLMANSGM